MLRTLSVMMFWRSHSGRYLLLLVTAICSVQYALLAEMREEPRPEASRFELDVEATESFSVLVDLIADGRVGLHGTFSADQVEAIEAPKLEVVDGVTSTIIFAEDEYLQRLITHYAEYYQVDPLLISMIMEQESGYDPFALSSAGAMGLMQLMPDTAWMLRVNDPWDPEDNIEGGVRYFAQQMDRFGRVELALAAYNAGPGSVDKWGGVPPYPETIEYVQNIMGRYKSETVQRNSPEEVYQFRD